MTPPQPQSTATLDGLIVALRNQLGVPDLAWATAPSPLAGGFWAELYVVELANAPVELQGQLVARVMPDPETAAFEIAAQRHVSLSGLSAPTIRASAGPTDDLDRAWCLMDFAAGQPLLSGLNASTAIKQAPMLLRRLPDLLAQAAAGLHAIPVGGLHEQLAGQDRQADIEHSLVRLAALAASIGRDDLARHAAELTIGRPDSTVICHGDMHPFNLLVDGDRWTLIDWSNATIADRHYDLAYTTLMLSNPPLGGPPPVRFAVRTIGRRISNRFLHTYARLTGLPIDTTRLTWGRRVHALRAVVEMATWESQGHLDVHASHPWLLMRDVFEGELAG